ncbi:MAG: hypothetical protein PHP24_10335, partial [Acidithiobacillus sp.]|nr:hypothetical protein [Acidithiobacillus sp.]
GLPPLRYHRKSDITGTGDRLGLTHGAHEHAIVRAMSQHANMALTFGAAETLQAKLLGFGGCELKTGWVCE